jgi:iron complex outermembrane receptor protein
MSKGISGRAGACLSLVCAIGVHGAHAQQQADALPTIAVGADNAAASPARGDDAAIELEEVVVTAQKRKQSLQDVPLSVGVVTGETLAQSGNFDSSSLENFVPNVEIDIDPQAPVIGIRGYDTETDNVGFEPAVGLVFDDLALGRAEFIPDGLFDMDRVEVLRGPQGTLFGKNTIAGVINFRSYEPDNILAGSLALTGGDDPLQRRAEAMLNVPIGENYAARVAGVYWDREGDVENSTLNRHENTLDQKAARVKFDGNPGENWHVSLSGQYSDLHVDYAPWQLDAASPAALRYAQGYDSSTEDNPLDAHTAFNTPGYVDRYSHVERALVDYTVGDVWGMHDVKLTTVFGHAAFNLATIIDADVSAADIIITDFRNAYNQDSVEFRPSGTADSLFGLAGPVEWTMGLYAFRSKLESHLDAIAGDNLVDFALSDAGLQALGAPDIGTLGVILDSLPNLPSVPINDKLLRGFWQDTQSYAVFGQMTWTLTEKLSAILGARFGIDEKKADFDEQRVGVGLVALVIGATPFTDTRRRTETDVSPKAGLQYQWARDLMTFATYTGGFKGGGFNATAASDSNLEFSPERASSFEAGFKSRFLDRRFTFNGSVYRTDIDNLQTVLFDGVTYQTANAAKARLQGVELESMWRPDLRWFNLMASVAFSNAEYVKYRDAPAASDDTSGSDTQDLSGRTLANAPTITGTVSPTLVFGLWPKASAHFGVDVAYRGDSYSSVDLDQHSYQSGYYLLGAHVMVGDDAGRWSIVVNGNNLTDKRTLDLVFDNSVYKHTYTEQQSPLRSVSATLKVGF